MEGSDDRTRDDSLFHIDDSLLRAECPYLSIKPCFPLIRSGSFSSQEQYHITPQDTSKNNYLILTTKNLCDSLSKEIRTYSEDVHAIYGYGIYLVSVENPNPEDLKSLIIDYRSKLCGAIFIGDLGEAIFESDHDHGSSYAYWPCDLFFMDLDTCWTDVDHNGFYDRHTGNVEPEVFIGRLSGKCLSDLGDEVTLIRNQLRKSHEFWWHRSYQISNTALNYIDCDWIDTDFDQDLEPIFSSGSFIGVRYGSDACFSHTDYLSRINSSSYGFTQVATHANPFCHQFFDNNYLYARYHIKNNVSSNLAYNLLCCSACNWTVRDSIYLGGAYLFNSGKTLAVVGSTKTGKMDSPGIFYSKFPRQNIGTAFLNWWKDCYGTTHDHYTVSWGYGMTLLGDPTINFRHDVRDYCENDLVLTSFPVNNNSNLVLYRAGNSITVSNSFTIPVGVHVVFDAPTVTFSSGFNCPLGASFEVRNEGCEL